MRLNYRPEIDGLRAIAVGAVILYHSKIKFLGDQPFKGGFIGVDIFFVISGYLITSIILRELYETGAFSFKSFYERRVRRLLPVLLFIMLASFPLAWMYLVPSSFIDFSKSILYSLGFGSNFYFHYSGQEYAAEDGIFKPFLHTWSLSVEEQYYILFPVILLITFKFYRKYLIPILILGFIISLTLAEWTSRNYPSASFYFLHTRMWELLAGSILAYFEIIRGHRSKHKILNLLLPTIGLVLIFHSIFFFNDEMLHPSLFTLSPIIGVCLIIWFTGKNEIVTRLLSSKLFVGIGLISYSLYLWHYPIFTFARITEFFGNNIIKELSAGIVILLLSIASYYFLERPFRNRKYQFKRLLIILLSFFTLLISVNFYVINNEGLNSRLPKIFQVKLKEENVVLYQKGNLQKVVLLGDSHAEALQYSLNEEIKKNNLNLYRLRTRFYLNDFNFVVNNKFNEDFIKSNHTADKFLNENSNLIVVYHLRWSIKLLSTWFDNEEGYKEEVKLTIPDAYFEPINVKTSSQEERQKYILENLKSQIDNITKQGHKLILVYPVPEMGFNVPRNLLKTIVRERVSANDTVPILSGSYDVYQKRNKLIFETLDSIENPDIYRVYPHEFFCDLQIKKRCVANDQENLFYFDDDHLSLKGSEFIARQIIKEIKKIESKQK
tara:strand:- start:2212 stop:4206 length:1995 start_codon:yes stop_codon:yes gene_type:complete